MGEDSNELHITWRHIAASLLAVVGFIFTTAIGVAGAYIKGRSDNWDSTAKIAAENKAGIAKLSHDVQTGFDSSNDRKRRIEESLKALSDELKKVGQDMNKSRCYSERCDEFDQRLRKGGL